MLTIGSLFSGACDGLALALEQLRVGRVEWHCEADAWRRRVLSKNWPGARVYEDVADVALHDERCMLDEDCSCDVASQRVDVLCGGFPCQGVSDAGLRRGIEHDERSGLWREFARIIGELRPDLVFVENVRGVRGRGWGSVLGDLAELGFDAEWTSLQGVHAGYPVRRERVFLLACAGEDGRRILRAAHDDRRRDASGDVAHRRDAIAAPPGPGSLGALRAWQAEHDGPPPGVRRDLAGIPDRVDRVAALGDSASPVLARLAWETLEARMLDEEVVHVCAS